MAVGLIDAVLDHAIASPERAAVVEIESGRVVDRGTIVAEATRLAASLDAHTADDATILVHGPSGAAFWSAVLAVFGSGRRLLPLGLETVASDLVALAEAHRVEAVIATDPATAGSGGPNDLLRMTIDLDAAASFDPAVARETLGRGDRGALLLRSSGTTGRPGVALRSASAIDRVSATLVETLGLRDDDRVLATLPMQHAYGIEHGVMAPMRAGAVVAFKPGFDLMAGADALLDGTTVFPAVPVTLEAATRVARLDHTLRLAYTAGSPLTAPVRDAFEAAWKVPVADLYGMTEVGTITWGFGDDRRAVPGVTIGVVDPEAGDEAATIRTHGVGELVVRSDAMFEGYVDGADARPESGRRVDGHLRTGDLGEIDEGGRVRITGRAKLQFDVGGLKVNPEEIEAVLARVSEVREVAVVPVPLSDTVTRVMAVVVPATDADPADIESAVRIAARESLSPHLRPRIVQVVDGLPRSATGKLLRGRLIAGFSATDG